MDNPKLTIKISLFNLESRNMTCGLSLHQMLNETGKLRILEKD